MIPAVIYARVSSKDQEREGYSIPAQLKLLREYAHARDFIVSKEFVDVETAKMTGRKQFGEMLRFLEQNPHCRVILVEKTDRLYRNFRDCVTLEDMEVEVHLAKEGQVISKDAKSQAKLMHGIQVVMARNYIENLREEVRKGMREKAEQGIYPSRPPIGYRNNKLEHSIEIDPERALIARRLFELYATGQHSLATLRKTISAEFGIRPAKGYLERILKNPFYVGSFYWDGKLYQGTQTRLISHDLFDQVQAVFEGRNRPKGHKYHFAFSGLLTCAYDDCAVTAEIKKGKYTYYHCTGYRGKCALPYLREEELGNRLGVILKDIEIPDEILAHLKASILADGDREAEIRKQQRDRLQQRLSAVQRRMDQAYLDKLDGKISGEFWERKRADWQTEEQQLLNELKVLDNVSPARRLDAMRILELANKAHSLYARQNANERAKLLQIVLSNCAVDAVNVYPTYRKPFDLIFRRAKTGEWCGTGVTKSESCPVSSDIASWESIGGNQGKGYARPAARNRHDIVWMVALVVWLLCLALAPVELRAADDPARLYAEGRKAERAGHMAQAYLLYSQAAALAPENQLYQLRSQAVQSRAALESPPKGPDLKREAVEKSLAPGVTVFDRLSLKDRAAARDPQPPPELKATPGRKDFDLRGDARILFEQVARAFALDTVFDGDYQAGQPFRFQVTEVDYREALHALEAVTGSFIVPISSRLFLVVKDSEQKRREVEPAVAITIPVPQATATQELVEIAQAVRQLFTLEHMAWDSQLNIVVLRDRISKVVPARMVFEQLLHNRPEVVIELQLVEVDRSSSLAYGLDLPTSFPLLYLGGFWNSKPSIASTITKLAVFGGGQTMFGIAIADASLIARMSRSSASTLLRTEVRALDGLPATLHVGDRFPVLTSGYFGPSSFQGADSYSPPPSFNFEDLGVTMKVTPRIHGIDDVTLDLDVEFKVLTGESLNGIPVISDRKMTSKVRLSQGEYGVIGGIMSSSEARTIRGIAGLSQIPVLGQLIRTNTNDGNTSDVLMLVKPTLLNLPPDQYESPVIWTGPDARPPTPL